MASLPSRRLLEHGITLPVGGKPAGSYAPVVIDGSVAWVSGQVVTREGVTVSPGQVDKDVDPARAKEIARLAALQALGALAGALGSIDRVRQVLRAAVYVASSPGFTRQHEVANGATELLIEVFGEAGRPARVAVGVSSLPLNACVEVELAVSFS